MPISFCEFGFLPKLETRYDRVVVGMSQNRLPNSVSFPRDLEVHNTRYVLEDGECTWIAPKVLCEYEHVPARKNHRKT